MTNDIRIATPTGTYIGHKNGVADEFLGIKYGKFVGPWKRLAALDTTEKDEFICAEHSPACIQPPDPCVYASAGKLAVEDSITLNLWTKDSGNHSFAKPVMVYFYGGGFVEGGNVDPAIQGENFVAATPEGEDAVLITVNYRIGIFGGMDLSFLEGYSEEEYGECNNIWILDQISALQWVHDNVAYFGGDPDNVTIFGQSAGSMSVAFLSVLPEANKLFHKGIMESGIPFFAVAEVGKKLQVAKNICADLGITTIEELISKDDDFWRENYSKEFRNNASLMPPRCFDKTLPADFWNRFIHGAAKDIPLMIGCGNGELDMYAYKRGSFPERVSVEEAVQTAYKHWEDFGIDKGSLNPLLHKDLVEKYVSNGKNEEDTFQRAVDIYNLFACGLGCIYYAEAQSKWNKNTYLYSWNWVAEGEDIVTPGTHGEISPWKRAPHCAELGVVFGHPDVAYPEYSMWWLGWSGCKVEKRYDPANVPEGLIQQAMRTWYNFAKTGDPNNEYIPEWKPYDTESRYTMTVNPEWRLEKDPFKEARETFAEARPYGEE